MPDPILAASPAAPTVPVTMVTPSPETAMLAERSRQREIRQMSAAFLASGALTQADVDVVIDDGTAVADAGQRFMARMAATQPPLTRPAQAIGSMRDEVDTRRSGMEMALVAQLTGKAPESDKAQPFMSMSIVEMAAKAASYSGSLRNSGDRDKFLMSGMHTNSDFPGIFENALNKTLLDRYVGAEPTYRRIAKKKSFNDFRVHPMVRPGDFPNLLPVGEAGEIKFGTFGEKRETAILTPYATGLRLSRQSIVNDEMGAIADMIADYGTRIVDFEEATFYAAMASATLASDGLAVWLTAATRGATAAGNLAAAGTVISVASVGLGAAVMRKQTSIDGIKLNIAPRILLVGPDKELEAAQVTTQVTPAQTSSVNPYAGKLESVVSAQITGNTWYLFGDANRAPCFVYGYLSGSEAPRLRMDEPFGVQGWAMTLSHDFGFGATDFRGTYRNPGA